MENSESSSRRSNSEKKLAIQLENPFALKVGQVFTGFGIGCGVGIGVGRPLNLGAIPALQQVMSATRGATDAFSGVGRHVNSSLRKLGAKNIEAGIGCGIGFGHGFGAGLAVKPGVVYRIQSCLLQATAKMMMKFGIFPGLSIGQSFLPGSLQSGMSMINTTSPQNPVGNIMHLASKTSERTSQEPPKDGNLFMGSRSEPLTGTPMDTSLGNRTEKVISKFLQNPLLKDEENTELNELAGRLQSENNVLQMILKHQQVIEELIEENEKLHRILVEDLKVPPGKLQGSNTSKTKPPSLCSECFECRRRQRKLK